MNPVALVNLWTMISLFEFLITLIERTTSCLNILYRTTGIIWVLNSVETFKTDTYARLQIDSGNKKQEKQQFWHWQPMKVSLKNHQRDYFKIRSSQVWNLKRFWKDG